MVLLEYDPPYNIFSKILKLLIFIFPFLRDIYHEFFENLFLVMLRKFIQNLLHSLSLIHSRSDWNVVVIWEVSLLAKTGTLLQSLESFLLLHWRGITFQTFCLGRCLREIVLCTTKRRGRWGTLSSILIATVTTHPTFQLFNFLNGRCLAPEVSHWKSFSPMALDQGIEEVNNPAKPSEYISDLTED